MKSYVYSTLRWSSLVLCSLLLVLLTACGGTGSTTTTATPTSAPSNPSPTPTVAPTTASANLTTYTGEGYTIGYPQDWHVKKSNNLVTFTDALGVSTLVIEVIPNPNAIAPTSTVMTSTEKAIASNGKNFQKVNGTSKATIAGDNWDQSSATEDATVSGQTQNVKYVILADNHPASSSSTKLFVIFYGTLTSLFDQTDSSSFQPMLQSFKFA
ncbi:MAG: hypothetical protein H0W02_02360 [Ktedonobacteraceae bacterium]|nr:hypothetical protein [Ktedonobacteraceae bacterium]